MIKVYSKENCSQCVATIKYLERAGIDFIVYKVDEDENALAFVKDLGYQSLPVVFVEENKHWSGFRPDKIAGLKP